MTSTTSNLTKCVTSATIAVALAAGTALIARAHEGDPGGGDFGGPIEFTDPAPLGISYEWTARLHKKQQVSFVWYVGAKSWSEPTQPDGLKGWTHTSNWVAIELEDEAKLKVVVERQGGVVFTSNVVPVVARAALVPALSLYSGWDDTTEFEDHLFNNSGNFWSTVEFIANEPNEKSKTRIVFATKEKLPPGKYSLVIGGNPASLGDPFNYPTSNCDPSEPPCYAYTGNHGYRATIQAR
jgi:hypothetical protein